MCTPFPQRHLSTSCSRVENSLSIEYDVRGGTPLFFVLGQVHSAVACARNAVNAMVRENFLPNPSLSRKIIASTLFSCRVNLASVILLLDASNSSNEKFGDSRFDQQEIHFGYYARIVI